jgi:hypothetical protein
MNTRICITSFNTVDVCNVEPSKVRYALHTCTRHMSCEAQTVLSKLKLSNFIHTCVYTYIHTYIYIIYTCTWILTGIIM